MADMQVNKDGLNKSRRKFLRQGATAMPVVLTLQSGAAHAVSSNLISAAPAGTTDASGNTLCLDTTTVPRVGVGDSYDLGEPPFADINVIPPREYHLEPNRGSPMVSAGGTCNGGTFHYHESGGWKQINLPANGVVVSSSATASVMASGGVHLTEL